MAFDPIAWVTGLLLTKAANKGLELAFPQTLRRDLEKEIEIWASSVPETAYLHPATLFSVVSTGDVEMVERPALKRLREQLLDLTIPQKELWLEGLFEQWAFIRKELGGDTQPFFQLSADDARSHLSTLSERIYRRCCQDEKTVMPHLVKGLDNIKVTLDELRQFHALKAIPSPSTAGDEGTTGSNECSRQSGCTKGLVRLFGNGQ